MEQKKYDWLLKVVQFDSSNYRVKVVSHFSFYDITREQVMQIAGEYADSFTVVRVYKLVDMLSSNE